MPTYSDGAAAIVTDAQVPNTITLDNITQITTRNISSLQGALISPANEIMNFPSIEMTDDAQPEWWEEDHANATLTEVDTSGESITQTYKRALKVVVSAGAHWAYQRFTYADQPRVKSGLSCSLWAAVWSVSSASARIGLGTSTPTTSYSTATTSAAWNLHRVDSLTLDGTYVDAIFEVTAGTAYFVPLGMVIGASPPTTALSMLPRPLKRCEPGLQEPTLIKTLSGLADEATWTDIDCTAATSNLAVMAQLSCVLNEAGSSTRYDLFTRRNNASDGTASVPTASSQKIIANVAVSEIPTAQWNQVLDDGQIFEYLLDRNAGATTLDFGEIYVLSWEEWA